MLATRWWLDLVAAFRGAFALISATTLDNGRAASDRSGTANGFLAGAPGRAHLIGIAGSGMRSLAAVLSAAGWQITGSDAGLAGALGPAGVGGNVAAFHSAANVPPESDVVIFSDAIGPENCERKRAHEFGIAQLSYPALLGKLLMGRRGIAIAGTHGKSTTTALAARIWIEAGLDPTVVLGARPRGWESGGRLGQGDFVLVEACEYRRNFLHLDFEAAVVLGIDHDHFDCFPSPSEYQSAFRDFVRRAAPGSLLLVHSDCLAALSRDVAPGARVVPFGTRPGDVWRAAKLEHFRGHYAFEVLRRGEPFLKVRLPIAGRHNVDNSLAAIALAAELGIGPEVIRLAVEAFEGIARRLEVVGTYGGVTVIDDYAHHPTAVAAAIATVREMYPGRPLQCVFEPHQASRVARLLDEFAQSLHNANNVIVTPIFRAREPQSSDRDMSAAVVAERVRAWGTPAVAADNHEETLRLLCDAVRPGDIVLTLGAGALESMRHGFVERLREICPAQ